MMYMLDTNIVSYLMRGQDEVLAQKVAGHIAKDICISSITYAELRYGIDRKDDGLKKSQLERSLILFLSGIRVVDFDDQASIAYGRICSALEKNGNRIGLMDMLIAANAISRGDVLITHNTREFVRIEGLKVEDWVLDPVPDTGKSMTRRLQ